MNAIIYLNRPQAKRIKFHIPYQAIEWRGLVKKLDGTFFHYHQKLWSIINTPEHIAKLKAILGDNIIYVDTVKSKSRAHIKLNDNALKALDAVMQKLILIGYSKNTQKSYQSELILYLGHFQDRDFTTITKDQIERYVYEQKQAYSISDSKQNLIINAIKFYHEHVLGQDRTHYTLTRPKKSKDLPNVLSPKQVLQLINSPKNLKHRTILTTIYSAGLRLSEVLNLRIQDIHRDQGYLFIKGAKGKKDRQTVLSDHLLQILGEYYRAYKPSYWLFEGQEGGKYSAASVQKIFRKAVKDSNIDAWATCHTLRHSFATHLIETGTSYRHIQVLLGHKSSKTTEIYTHVVGINNKTILSPLDRILAQNRVNT